MSNLFFSPIHLSELFGGSRHIGFWKFLQKRPKKAVKNAPETPFNLGLFLSKGDLICEILREKVLPFSGETSLLEGQKKNVKIREFFQNLQTPKKRKFSSGKDWRFFDFCILKKVCFLTLFFARQKFSWSVWSYPKGTLKKSDADFFRFSSFFKKSKNRKNVKIC